MILLVGLGNPGAQYARHRHNIGFMAVDAIAESHGFGPERTKFQGLLREGRLGTEKALILKPQTFMNESGRSVAEAARFYKLDPEAIFVFHDELDLAPGKIRVKRGGGHAGHNGLRSIQAHIGAEFRRARLGVGHPGDKTRVSGYVLHDFSRADRDWLDPLLESIGRRAALIASQGDARFQQAVAQDIAPAAAPKPKKAAPQAAASGGAAAGAERARTEQDTPFAKLKKLLKGE